MILPPLFRVAEILVPIAATRLVLLMIGAMTLDARRGGEARMITVNLVLAPMAGGGRLGPLWPGALKSHSRLVISKGLWPVFMGTIGGTTRSFLP